MGASPMRFFQTMHGRGARATRLLAFALLGIILATGCSRPNAANIELRKQNAELRGQIETLNRQHEADVASIRGLQKSGASTMPSIPPERLATLFTVHGIQFGKLTGGADLDPKTPGDDGVKVYVTPFDQDGEPLKAAGSFVVEAFDLDAEKGIRIARSEFPLEEARKNWYGQALLHTYVLTCRWEKPPTHADVTIKVTYTDALTGRVFDAQKQVKVSLKDDKVKG
jgi:hypothetical protein